MKMLYVNIDFPDGDFPDGNIKKAMIKYDIQLLLGL